MDWGQVGTQIAGAGAKILGEVIPMPGASAVANQVADALGTSSEPDAIAQALEQDPDAAQKLKQIEADHKEELERIKAERHKASEEAATARQAAVNSTIQEGYKQGVLWRRAVGWSLAVIVPVTILGVLALVGAALYLDRPEMIGQLPGIVSALSPIWYVYLTVLGIAGYQEGKMGRALAGDKDGGMERAIKAIQGRD